MLYPINLEIKESDGIVIAGNLMESKAGYVYQIKITSRTIYYTLYLWKSHMICSIL